MKRLMTVGVVAEILLVAGILLVALGVYVAATNQTPIGACLMRVIGCDFYASLFEWQIFYAGLVLLVASAVGFLVVLRLSRSKPIPQGEASN